MDPLDHVRAGLDGLRCAVCNGPVPAGSVKLLANRDGLAFVQLDCDACRSTTLAFLLDGASDLRDDAPANRASGASEAVSADDVLDMHVFLRGWQGGLADLVGGATGTDRR
jgi:hypothetical protein